MFNSINQNVLTHPPALLAYRKGWSLLPYFFIGCIFDIGELFWLLSFNFPVFQAGMTACFPEGSQNVKHQVWWFAHYFQFSLNRSPFQSVEFIITRVRFITQAFIYFIQPFSCR
jgi:hypothetical protein